MCTVQTYRSWPSSHVVEVGGRKSVSSQYTGMTFPPTLYIRSTQVSFFFFVKSFISQKYRRVSSIAFDFRNVIGFPGCTTGREGGSKDNEGETGVQEMRGTMTWRQGDRRSTRSLWSLYEGWVPERNHKGKGPYKWWKSTSECTVGEYSKGPVEKTLPLRWGLSGLWVTRGKDGIKRGIHSSVSPRHNQVRT